MPFSRFIAVFFAVFGFVFAARAACDLTGRPENALEQRLFDDAADGRLDAFSPLDAALIAGGIDNADSLRRYDKKIAALIDELRQSDTVGGGPKEKAAAIFAFLHRRVLTGGYDLACTDLRRTLDDGRFNCVSATVLFNHFATAFGLDCRGLEMPGHAMSRLRFADKTFDIENTCPGWFGGSADPWRVAARTSRAIGAAAAADHAKAREVSPIQIAAMVYYNRGVDCLAEKRFADAATCNAKSLRLDPANATTHGNLLATINNWAIALGDSGHYVEAVALLRQGFSLDRHFAPFAQNYVHVYHQWTESLCKAGRFAEAETLLTRAAAEVPERGDYFRQARREVREQEATMSMASSKQPWVYVKNVATPD